MREPTYVENIREPTYVELMREPTYVELMREPTYLRTYERHYLFENLLENLHMWKI